MVVIYSTGNIILRIILVLDLNRVLCYAMQIC